MILLNTPVYEPLTAVQPEAYQKALQIIAEKAAERSNTALIDLSPEFTGHTAFFFDPIHMNPEGQNAVTKTFVQRLNKMLAISTVSSGLEH